MRLLLTTKDAPVDDIFFLPISSFYAIKSTGPDGLPACYLRDTATEIAEPLTINLWVLSHWSGRNHALSTW